MSTRMELTQTTRTQILSLHELGYGTRQIARRLGCSRKIVRRVLSEAGRSQPPPHCTPGASCPSKLAPFQMLIDEKVRQGLTTSRILREIRATGYQGGRTILADQVRQLRARVGRSLQTSVKRRFETPAGVEMQIDWSPYLIPVGTRPQKVHALGCLLCHSRKLFVHCFADERQPTLLEGLAMAFEYFQGAAHRVVLDNMATAVLGRYQPDGRTFAREARRASSAAPACAGTVRAPERSAESSPREKGRMKNIIEWYQKPCTVFFNLRLAPELTLEFGPLHGLGSAPEADREGSCGRNQPPPHLFA